MKFLIKDFFRKCDQIRRKLRIWSPLLKKFLMENFIFCAVFLKEKWWRYLFRTYRVAHLRTVYFWKMNSSLRIFARISNNYFSGHVFRTSLNIFHHLLCLKNGYPNKIYFTAKIYLHWNLERYRGNRGEDNRALSNI